MLQMTSVESIWLILLIIFGGGLIVGKLMERPRIPDVAGFLLFGILIGRSGLGLIDEPPGSVLTQFILTIGAAVILFDGGRGQRLNVLATIWPSIALLATVGVLVSALATGWALTAFFGLPWIAALLVAAIIAPTDPATLIPVFHRVPIEERLEQAVESESAFNDATGSIVAFTMLSLALNPGSIPLWQPIVGFAQAAAFGLGAGVAVGLLCLWVVSNSGWGVLREFGSVVMFTGTLLAYQVAEWIGGSGFMAAFVAGIMVGNAVRFGLPLVEQTVGHLNHFMSALTLLLRMLIFTLLGSQVNFQVVGHYLLPGLAVIAVFLLIARPLTVLSSTLPDRLAKWRRNEILFMFWTRETGVIPAALSVLLVAEGAPHADVITAITFLAIVVTIFLQATTTGWVARKLRVARWPAPEQQI